MPDPADRDPEFWMTDPADPDPHPEFWMPDPADKDPDPWLQNWHLINLFSVEKYCE
jgi:hypothetical protein